MAVIAEDEIAGDTTRTKQLISSITGYPDLFFKAFGSKEITMERNFEGNCSISTHISFGQFQI